MKRWWILKDRLRHGPFSESELSRHVQAGRFDLNDFVSDETSQSITQLSYRTLRDVLGPSFAIHAEPVTISNVSLVADVSVGPEIVDEDTVPHIREMLSKMEAVELVESEKAPEEVVLTYHPANAVIPNGGAQGLNKILSRLFPLVAGAALIFVAVWLIGDEPAAVVVKKSSTDAVTKQVEKLPARKPASQSPVVTVPRIAVRREEVPEQMSNPRRPMDDLEETGAREPREMRDEEMGPRTPSARAAARRKKLQKLRQAVAPDTRPENNDDHVAGVENGEHADDQSNFDEDRQFADEASESPTVEPFRRAGVVRDEPEEGIDDEAGVEYQE